MRSLVRPWQELAAKADKTITPTVGETLEYLWDGYRGEGQWRSCTITRIDEGHSWTRLHGRMYWGLDHADRHPREQILHVRAFCRKQPRVIETLDQWEEEEKKMDAINFYRTNADVDARRDGASNQTNG